MIVELKDPSCCFVFSEHCLKHLQCQFWTISPFSIMKSTENNMFLQQPENHKLQFYFIRAIPIWFFFKNHSISILPNRPNNHKEKGLQIFFCNPLKAYFNPRLKKKTIIKLFKKKISIKIQAKIDWERCLLNYCFLRIKLMSMDKLKWKEKTMD